MSPAGAFALAFFFFEMGLFLAIQQDLRAVALFLASAVFLFVGLAESQK